MPPFPVLVGTTLWWQLLGRGAACPLPAVGILRVSRQNILHCISSGRCGAGEIRVVPGEF